MKLNLLGAAGAAATLVAVLAGCFTAGSEARGLAKRWVEGDTSVQCVDAPSASSAWELGGTELLG